jgi:hypothetical protein
MKNTAYSKLPHELECFPTANTLDIADQIATAQYPIAWFMQARSDITVTIDNIKWKISGCLFDADKLPLQDKPLELLQIMILNHNYDEDYSYFEQLATTHLRKTFGYELCKYNMANKVYGQGRLCDTLATIYLFVEYYRSGAFKYIKKFDIGKMFISILGGLLGRDYYKFRFQKGNAENAATIRGAIATIEPVFRSTMIELHRIASPKPPYNIIEQFLCWFVTPNVDSVDMIEKYLKSIRDITFQGLMQPELGQHVNDKIANDINSAIQGITNEYGCSTCFIAKYYPVRPCTRVHCSHCGDNTGKVVASLRVRNCIDCKHDPVPPRPHLPPTPIPPQLLQKLSKTPPQLLQKLSKTPIPTPPTIVCGICKENTPDTMFEPCHHTACSKCASIETCHKCGYPITSQVEFYL